MNRAGRTLVVALLLPVAGCASSRYRPMSTPLLRKVQESGIEHWEAGDRRAPVGIFVGGFGDLVKDVPESAEAVREAESTATWGFVLTMVGSTLAAFGAAEATLAGFDESMVDDQTGLFGTGLLLGGLGFLIGGALGMLDARARELDAVNLFNDTMWLRLQGERLELQRE